MISRRSSLEREQRPIFLGDCRRRLVHIRVCRDSNNSIRPARILRGKQGPLRLVISPCPTGSLRVSCSCIPSAQSGPCDPAQQSSQSLRRDSIHLAGPQPPLAIHRNSLALVPQPPAGPIRKATDPLPMAIPAPVRRAPECHDAPLIMTVTSMQNRRAEVPYSAQKHGQGVNTSDWLHSMFRSYIGVPLGLQCFI